MVDSSKTAWGSGLTPFRLEKKLGSDFLMIHLVRDPRAVCWSTLRTLPVDRMQPRKKIARYLRTIFGWLGANIACEVFRLLHPSRYLRIRYEDIVSAPELILPSLFDAAGLQSWRPNQPGSNDNRHQLYGNRIRREPLLLATIKEDVAWKAKMPRFFRALAVILTIPFFLKYGYFRSGTPNITGPRKLRPREIPPAS
jgi:hypothetical protein